MLFVCTKPHFKTLVEDVASGCGSHYVTQRWLGGMITNWVTIKSCINNLQLLCVFLLLFVYIYKLIIF